jgi:hypothetical protein
MSTTTTGLGPLDVVSYSPGVCNIGPAEVARRRMVGHIALAVTIAVLAALIVVGAPHLARLVLVVPAAGSATGYLQAYFHFCAGFGSRGVYNFGPVGTVVDVADKEARARDRATSTRIGVASVLVGVAVAVAAVLLPF